MKYVSECEQDEGGSFVHHTRCDSLFSVLPFYPCDFFHFAPLS